MLSLEAQLKAACELDLNRETPTTFPSQDEDTFAADYLLYNLLRKVEPYEEKRDVPVQVLKDSLSKFADSEWRCRVINICGRFYSPLYAEDATFFSEAIRLAKSYISNVMMDRWPRWEDASYTSGASRGSSRKQSQAFVKFAGYSENSWKLSATAPALEIVSREIAPHFGIHWNPSGVEIVNDCRFDFVHKTSSSVRFMSLQPEYNMLTQKCVGDCIRDALLDATIDLNDQRWNQHLAYLGSLNRGIATIDLTNSSDNIALQHGEMFFPSVLMQQCMATRVTHATVGGFSHRLEKLATQGNGFIFEAQSLLYAGLVHAVTTLKGGREIDSSVYGDDIVISTECAQPLMDLLVYLGMEPNLSKSYWGDEPFRESCGEHYINGQCVTPFYVKRPLTTLRAKFRALNGLLYWEQRTGRKLTSAIKLLVASIPKKDRQVVPSNFSIDCGIHFAVSGCTFPRRIVRHGELTTDLQVLQSPKESYRSKLGDWALYTDFLQSPPSPIVEDAIWGKLQYRNTHVNNRIPMFHSGKRSYDRRHTWPALGGVPTDPKTYSYELESTKVPAVWGRLTTVLG